MTRKTFIFLLAFTLLSIYSGVWVYKVYSNAAGAPSGFTGSPYDAVSCATTGCHPGIPQTAFGWIASDMPIAGYFPDSTYTITFTAKRPGATNFGFQACALSMANEFTGTWILTDPIQTQFGFAYRYLNQTASGIAGSQGKKIWTAKWKAPPDDYAVTFYAAFIAGNGNQSQDITYISDVWFSSVFIGMNTQEREAKLKLSPLPIVDMLTINLILSFPQKVYFSILSIDGKLVDSWTESAPHAGRLIFTRDLSLLLPGNYILSINAPERSFHKKIILLP